MGLRKHGFFGTKIYTVWAHMKIAELREAWRIGEKCFGRDDGEHEHGEYPLGCSYCGVNAALDLADALVIKAEQRHAMNLSLLRDIGDRLDALAREWCGTTRGLQLDRVNNDGNYEPSNCRWATRSQNCKNRSNRSSEQSKVDKVSYDSQHRQWKYLRIFKTQEEAEKFASDVSHV